MNIGITYDLRDEYLREGYSQEETAEFDSVNTINAIKDALVRLGHQAQFIGNIKQLCAALVNGQRWDMVFNICEGMYGFGREAQVPALLDAWNIPYVFSDPLVLSVTLHKGFTKMIIRNAGIPTADFVVAESVEELHGVNIPYPLFVKPVAEGTGKGITSKSVIETEQQLLEIGGQILSQFKQPILIERFLPGREFTVGVLGRGDACKSLGVMEIVVRDNSRPKAYSYENKEEYEQRVEYRLVDKKLSEQCERVALDAWKVLGAKDAGRVDLRMDHLGVPNFIEVNPLAGLHPTHSDLPILCGMSGVGYDQLIAMIMDEALEKLN